MSIWLMSLKRRIQRAQALLWRQDEKTQTERQTKTTGFAAGANISIRASSTLPAIKPAHFAKNQKIKIKNCCAARTGIERDISKYCRFDYDDSKTHLFLQHQYILFSACMWTFPVRLSYYIWTDPVKHLFWRDQGQNSPPPPLTKVILIESVSAKCQKQQSRCVCAW